MGDDFDDSDVRFTARQTNEDLRHLATVRVMAALAKAEVELRAIGAEYDALDARRVAAKLEIDNWLELLRGLRAQEK